MEDNMNPKEMIVSIAAAMMIAAVFASSAMAITVDGNPIDWNPSDKLCDDPTGDTNTPGYNIVSLWSHFEANTAYFRIDVLGTPGDADGNGNPDTVIGPYEYVGVGVGAVCEREQYIIEIDSDNDNDLDYILKYCSGGTTLYAGDGSTEIPGATTHAAHGDVVEFSIALDTHCDIDPTNYCVRGWADTQYDGNEDRTDEVCRVTTEPPAFSFTHTQKCDLEVRFSGHGSDSDGHIVNHTWDFGDGSAPVTSNGAPGIKYHTFPAEATYTVTLSGYDDDGLSGTTSQTFLVSFVPCEEVPVLTPIGTIALIGLLSLIGVGIIMRRR